MSEKDLRDREQAATSASELRALLASYEHEVLGSTLAAARNRAAGTRIGDAPILLNGVSVDLRASALQGYGTIEASDITDCSGADASGQPAFVHKVTSGTFRVHPRRGVVSAGLLGPYSGPPPVGVTAFAQTTHASAPAVRFHISLWTAECDPSTIRGRLATNGGDLGFVTIEPERQGLLVATAGPQPGPDAPADPSSPWGVLLATMAEPPENFEYAWADFSRIVLLFSSDRGSDIRLLV